MTFAVTGTFHGSIVHAESEGVAGNRAGFNSLQIHTNPFEWVAAMALFLKGLKYKSGIWEKEEP